MNFYYSRFYNVWKDPNNENSTDQLAMYTISQC